MISQKLLQTIRSQYQLPWRGLHGVAHWARVLENGLRLAPLTGASLPVIWFFAVFHDAQRHNEDYDPDHGARGAKLAATLRGSVFDLLDHEFDLLSTACIYHAEGLTNADVTIQTCWDADRLDLGRVGIRPDPKRLCTKAAQSPEIIEWAYARSLQEHEPLIVSQAWHIQE